MTRWYHLAVRCCQSARRTSQCACGGRFFLAPFLNRVIPPEMLWLSGKSQICRLSRPQLLRHAMAGAVEGRYECVSVKYYRHRGTVGRRGVTARESGQSRGCRGGIGCVLDPRGSPWLRDLAAGRRHGLVRTPRRRGCALDEGRSGQGKRSRHEAGRWSAGTVERGSVFQVLAWVAKEGQPGAMRCRVCARYRKDSRTW